MSTDTYATEHQAWFASDEGRECSDIQTLESAQSQEHFQLYLANRLDKAFAAGWDRCHAEILRITKEHFDGVGK